MQDGLLREASIAYARRVVSEYEFPAILDTFSTLIRLAFTEGALWYNQYKLAQSEAELKEAEERLQEALNA